MIHVDKFLGGLCLTQDHCSTLALVLETDILAGWLMDASSGFSPRETGAYMTYAVADEDPVKAVAMIRTLVGSAPRVESIGRASPELLLALGLSAGEFKEVES